MKTLIVGAGIIGSIYGWALSKAGCAVTHLVRPGKSDQFATGILIDILDNRKGYVRAQTDRYYLRVTEELRVSDDFDLVIVPTKPYQVEDALRQIVPYTQRANYLLLTQNWSGTTTIDSLLAQSRYVYGDAKAGGCYRDATLISTIFPTIDLGRANGQKDSHLAEMATLFESIGIKPNLRDNILHYIWVQYAISAGLWPGLVRAGDFKSLLRDRHTVDLSLLAVKECLNVAAHRGIDLRKYPETRMYTTSSSFVREVAGLMLRMLFRFNKSIQRMLSPCAGRSTRDQNGVLSSAENRQRTGSRNADYERLRERYCAFWKYSRQRAAQLTLELGGRSARKLSANR